MVFDTHANLTVYPLCVCVKKTDRNLESNLRELKDSSCQGFYNLHSLVDRDIIFLGSEN
jgi:hypothetical protein